MSDADGVEWGNEVASVDVVWISAGDGEFEFEADPAGPWRIQWTAGGVVEVESAAEPPAEGGSSKGVVDV